MEREKRKKEAEEAEVRRLEAERRQKAEMEARRKEEEARSRRQEEQDRIHAEKLQRDLDNANNKIADQVVYRCTAVLLYRCTTVPLYCCTAVLLYCCIAVPLYRRTKQTIIRVSHITNLISPIRVSYLTQPTYQTSMSYPIKKSESLSLTADQ